MTLRVVFMGTPDFAVPALSDILAHGHDVVAVYTEEPAAAGWDGTKAFAVQRLADASFSSCRCAPPRRCVRSGGRRVSRP